MRGRWFRADGSHIHLNLKTVNRLRIGAAKVLELARALVREGCQVHPCEAQRFTECTCSNCRLRVVLEDNSLLDEPTVLAESNRSSASGDGGRSR